jgi:glycosyltransferase involved in cell wall biosynthesis
LIYLNKYLADNGIDLFAIELFGKGSPYSFDSYNNVNEWWTCVFPDRSAEELTKKEIKNSLFLLLDEIRPDIVIASSIVFFAGALGIRWAKANRRKFVMFEDAKPEQVKRNFFVQFVKDLIIAQSDAFWLPSNNYDKVYSFFQRKGIFFFYGYNCVDNDRFKPSGIKTFNHNVILCVARLVPIKNIDNLLRSWKIIEDDRLNCKLMIIGSGPEEPALKRLTEELCLKQVEFLGAVDNHVMPYYYFNADALILPSWSETWGLVVNEAMAAGLPVLISNKVNACHSLLIPDVNGYAFNPDNISDIANAIKMYTELDQQARINMSMHSLRIIEDMSYKKMGDSFVEAVSEINDFSYKRPGILASLVLNSWTGRYNTSGWDKLQG